MAQELQVYGLDNVKDDRIEKEQNINSRDENNTLQPKSANFRKY